MFLTVVTCLKAVISRAYVWIDSWMDELMNEMMDRWMDRDGRID